MLELQVIECLSMNLDDRLVDDVDINDEGKLIKVCRVDDKK